MTLFLIYINAIYTDVKKDTYTLFIIFLHIDGYTIMIKNINLTFFSFDTLLSAFSQHRHGGIRNAPSNRRTDPFKY